MNWRIFPRLGIGIGLDDPELTLDSASMRADHVLINCTDRLVWQLRCGPWRWTDGLLKDWLCGGLAKY